MDNRQIIKIVPTLPGGTATPGRVSIDQAINAWIDKSAGKSHSAATEKKYRETIDAFRLTLQAFNLDLDSDTYQVSLTAQGWAALRSPDSHFQGEISNATFNQRLAIISSFYTYVRKYRLLDITENPIEMNDRKNVQAYAAAIAMDDKVVQKKLKAIPRGTLEGKRDLAILTIALSTGRRAAELSGMRWGHLRQEGRKVVVTFPHCKGGQVMIDELGPKTAELLMSYLHGLYSTDLGQLANNAPIWVSFSRNGSKGRPIGTRAVADICEKWLGTSKVHTTRHTFAMEMEKVGATLSEIGGRLGHKNLKTTSDYMRELHKPENKYTPQLEALYGISNEEEA